MEALEVIDFKASEMFSAGVTHVHGAFLESAYLGAKPALSWREIVRANEWTMAAQEAAESGVVIPIKPAASR